MATKRKSNATMPELLRQLNERTEILIKLGCFQTHLLIMDVHTSGERRSELYDELEEISKGRWAYEDEPEEKEDAEEE